MAESKINVATGFNGGVSVSLRADSSAEFEALLWDVSQSATLTSLLKSAGLNASAPTEQQAIANVQQAFPNAQVSTVGQPLPQPGQQAAAPAAATPPNVPYPGNCEHGVRQYVDKPARGKAWRRWECSIPWSRDNAASRCKPVNVDN